MSKISSILFLFSCFTVAGYSESIDRFAEIARKPDVREQISACHEILNNPGRYETGVEIEKGSLTELFMKTDLVGEAFNITKIESLVGEHISNGDLIKTIKNKLLDAADTELKENIEQIFRSGTVLSCMFGYVSYSCRAFSNARGDCSAMYSYLAGSVKTNIDAGLTEYKLAAVKCTPQVKQYSMNNSLLNFQNIMTEALPVYESGISAYNDKPEIRGCLEEIKVDGKEWLQKNKSSYEEIFRLRFLPAVGANSVEFVDKVAKVTPIVQESMSAAEVKLAPQDASGDPVQSVEGASQLRKTPDIGGFREAASVIPKREVVSVPSNGTPSPKILSGELLDASALGVANGESSMIGKNSSGATGLFSDSQLSLVSMMSINSFCDTEILKIINASNMEAGLITKELLELRELIEDGKLKQDKINQLSTLGITEKVGKIIAILKVKLAIPDDTLLEDLIKRLYIEEDSRYSPFVISFKFKYMAENINTTCVLTDFADEMIKNAWQGYSGEKFEGKQTNVERIKKLLIYIRLNELEENKTYKFLDLLNATQKAFTKDIADDIIKVLFTLPMFVPDEFTKWVSSYKTLPSNEYTKPLCDLMEIANSSFELKASRSEAWGHGKKRCIRWIKGGKECFYTGESGTVEVKGKIKKEDRSKLVALVKQVNLSMENCIQQSSRSESFSAKKDDLQQLAVPIPSDGRPPRAPVVHKK